MECCVLKYSLQYEEVHQNELFSNNCNNEIPLNHFIQGETEWVIYERPLVIHKW